MASRDTTFIQTVKCQEKAKKQLNDLFDELEFMFTDTTAVRVLPDGKRDRYYGDVLELRPSIQTVNWLHISKLRGRWYALVTLADGQHAYIRCNYEAFWSIENTLRFYVSSSPTELINHAMKKHTYKIYKKRVDSITSADVSS